jgi:hypothetical protein
MKAGKLVKMIRESKNHPQLPKSGAGEWGTDELVKNYMRDTPGQVIKFKDFKKRTK